MLPTKKRCPRCGRVLPAEAFNLVRGGRELAGWCRVCNHRYYLDRKEAGFVRKNPSGRRIAHGGYLLLRQTRILHGKVFIREDASVLRGILLEPVVGHIEVVPVL